MKRESLITKLVAFMLCVMMVVGCLPVSAFAAENDWEGDIDVVETEPPVGSEGNPIHITPGMLVDGEYVVNIPGSTTYYFSADYLAGKEMRIDGGDPVILNAQAYAFTITNEIESEMPYTISFAIPVGSMDNPADAYLGDNEATVAAGSQGYYWTYIADYTGELIVNISSDNGWTYFVNNLTTYQYGDTQWSDSDPVVNPAVVSVTAGDELQIMVNTYDPADKWNAPAGTVTLNLSYPAGSAANPIFLTGDDKVENTGTLYYQGRFGGQTVTFEGTGDFAVEYNGETINAVDGKIEISVANGGFFAPPALFALTGEGEFHIVATWPLGHMENPAVAVLGDNVGTVAEGSQGYFWTYTAEKAGDLVFNFSSSDGNWTYTINNMTTYVYGDKQWSDSDPVVNPATITVAAGDEIQIIACTYDPENEWNAPAGDVTVNLAYKVEEPVMPEVGQLKFSAISLVLQASLTANYKVDGKYFADGAYTNPYVTFDFAGKETIVVTDYYIQNDGTYVFPLTGISPQLMNENIVAVIYAEYNGTTFNSNEQNYSIAKYCYSQLGKSTNAKFRTMLVDLLNYGAAAQIKAPWKADELVNAALTAEQQAEASKHELVFEDHQNTKYNVIDAPTVSWKAISLVLDSTVATKITFAASDISNLTVRFTLADGTVLADYTKDDMVAAASAGQYYVIFDKMNANQMHVPFYVTVYEGDTVVSNTLQYSVVTYVGKQQAKAEEKLLNLMNAMLRYGDSAKAYGG